MPGHDPRQNNTVRRSKRKTPKPGHRSRSSLSGTHPGLPLVSPVETVESIVERTKTPSCGAETRLILEKGDRSRKAADQVPQPDRPVSGAGEQQFGAGALAEGDAVDAVAMPCQLDEQIAASGVPDPNSVVDAPGGQGPAVGAEGQAPDPSGGGGNDVDGTLCPASVHIPQSHRVLPAATREELAVRAERHGVDLVSGLEAGNRRAAFHVPEPGRAVGARAGKKLPVRAERDRPNRPAMPGKGGDLPAGTKTPQPDRGVSARRGQHRAVRAEHHVRHRVEMTGEPADGPAVADIPQPDRPFVTTGACGRQHLAVRAEPHRGDRTDVTGNRGALSVGVEGIYEADRGVGAAACHSLPVRAEGDTQDGVGVTLEDKRGGGGLFRPGAARGRWRQYFWCRRLNQRGLLLDSLRSLCLLLCLRVDHRNLLLLQLINPPPRQVGEIGPLMSLGESLKLG